MEEWPGIFLGVALLLALFRWHVDCFQKMIFRGYRKPFNPLLLTVSTVSQPDFSLCSRIE